MTHHYEALRILRRAGEAQDDKINLGETALALASLEKPERAVQSYSSHLSDLVEALSAEGSAVRLDDQLRLLRRVLVVQNKYQGDDKNGDESASNNLVDVIDRRSGSPVALGLLYLHVADALGWAMTGIDLSGHFLLRLSARDGQAVIDPFRAGQTCQIVQSTDPFFDEIDADDLSFFDEPWGDEAFLDLSSDLLLPLSRRDVLLKLQHNVKRHHLAHDRVDTAIATLQSMALFAPKDQDVWRELSHLQAERGHIRAAITALEVVRDLDNDRTPLQQTGDKLRELRWRLN